MWAELPLRQCRPWSDRLRTRSLTQLVPLKTRAVITTLPTFAGFTENPRNNMHESILQIGKSCTMEGC